MTKRVQAGFRCIATQAMSGGLGAGWRRVAGADFFESRLIFGGKLRRCLQVNGRLHEELHHQRQGAKVSREVIGHRYPE